jgi:hypothetical protein
MKKIFLEADERNEKAIVRYRRFIGFAFRKKANYIRYVKVFNQYTRK